ncbi:MAG TPA: ABC transporter permease subunit [Chloroflexota bacterium]|nr:ABC transporter permease subunit [Chloroflexota bacterium]
MLAPLIAIILGLLATVFWLSALSGLPGTAGTSISWSNYVSLYADPFAATALANTFGFAGVSIALALVFGTAIAWLVERTDLPGKNAIFTLMSLGLLLPNFFLAMGWLFLLHPRIGAINRWLMAGLGLQDAPFNILTVWGMGWVEGLGLAALVFVLTSASFRAMDPALEEAATIHGARFGQSLRRVLLPLVFPAVLGSALYIFTIAFASFDVPAIIGWSNRIYTFSTFVYAKSTTAQGLPEYGATAAMSSLLVVVALLFSWWYGNIIKRGSQYQIVTGKAYRPRLIALGKWVIPAWLFVGGYFVVSKLMPLLLVIWAAALPFFQPPSLQALGTISGENFARIPFDVLSRGVWHTAVLMIAVPTGALLLSAAFSWAITRWRTNWRVALDFFAFLPHAVPNIIFGVGALFVALFLLKGLQLYGSLALLAMVYIVVRLSFGTRLLNGALLQVHRELEEAAALSGASALRTARQVVAPLLWPALVNGWLWIALETYRELTLATVLYSPSNITLPVTVWSIWLSGNLGVASAVSLVLLCCLAPLVLVYWTVGRRGAPAGAS